MRLAERLFSSIREGKIAFPSREGNLIQHKEESAIPQSISVSCTIKYLILSALSALSALPTSTLVSTFPTLPENCLVFRYSVDRNALVLRVSLSLLPLSAFTFSLHF